MFYSSLKACNQHVFDRKKYQNIVGEASLTFLHGLFCLLTVDKLLPAMTLQRSVSNRCLCVIGHLAITNRYNKVDVYLKFHVFTERGNLPRFWHMPKVGETSI